MKWILAGRNRLQGASCVAIGAVFVLGIISACSFALTFIALIRSQSVVGFEEESLDLFVDLDSGATKPYDLATAVTTLIRKWGMIQRWADVFADFFRAGQRFLVVSVIFGLAAGLICYFHPDVDKIQKVRIENRLILKRDQPAM